MYSPSITAGQSGPISAAARRAAAAEHNFCLLLSDYCVSRGFGWRLGQSATGHPLSIRRRTASARTGSFGTRSMVLTSKGRDMPASGDGRATAISSVRPTSRVLARRAGGRDGSWRRGACASACSRQSGYRRITGRGRRRSCLVQGHSLRGASRRRPAVAASPAGGTVDRRAASRGVRRELHAGTIRTPSPRRCARAAGSV